MNLNIIPTNTNNVSGKLTEKLGLLASEILSDHNKHELQVNLMLLSSEEMITLNLNFRNKPMDTNVLSFPLDKNFPPAHNQLGDIAISIPFVESEAKDLNRNIDDHMMHLIAHGILHLLGYDHIEDKDANLMESIEIGYLEKFNIANPYLI